MSSSITLDRVQVYVLCISYCSRSVFSQATFNIIDDHFLIESFLSIPVIYQVYLWSPFLYSSL